MSAHAQVRGFQETATATKRAAHPGTTPLPLARDTAQRRFGKNSPKVQVTLEWNPIPGAQSPSYA
jgi:hypothetical protein